MNVTAVAWLPTSIRVMSGEPSPAVSSRKPMSRTRPPAGAARSSASATMTIRPLNLMATLSSRASTLVLTLAAPSCQLSRSSRRTWETLLAQGLPLARLLLIVEARLVEGLAGFEQRLQIAEHPAPAAACAGVLAPAREDVRELRRSFELVDHGEPGGSAFVLLDFERQPREAFRFEFRVHDHAPRLDELARRVDLDQLTVDDRSAQADFLHAGSGQDPVGGTRPQVSLDRAAVAIAIRPLGLRDRIPDRLGRRVDVHPVDLGRHRRLRHRRHALSSNSFLRFASADTWRSVYLSIHRSWINRIGTGFRKCSFSRPCRRVTTRPASSRTRRCFMTPKRVISNPDSSYISVRPSRLKSRSSRKRRVGSASALNTRSSSVPGAYVTKRSHVNRRRYRVRDRGGDELHKGSILVVWLGNRAARAGWA